MEYLRASEKKILLCWGVIVYQCQAKCGSDILYLSWLFCQLLKKCWNFVILSLLFIFALCIFEALFLEVYIHVELCLFDESTTLLLQNVSFIFDHNHCLDIHFICYKYSHSSFHDYFPAYLFLSQPLSSGFLFLKWVFL